MLVILLWLEKARLRERHVERSLVLPFPHMIADESSERFSVALFALWSVSETTIHIQIVNESIGFTSWDHLRVAELRVRLDW